MTLIVRTVAEQAYHAVRERILRGDLAAGSPVRQDTIADDLGVSKIPLREALTRLEQDGLLSSSPNKGYVVRPLSAAEADEVFALRLKLEPDAAAQAAERFNEAGRATAVAAFEAMGAADGPQSPDYVLANRLFHLALVRPGVGRVTGQMVERLHVLAERYVRVHLQPAGRAGRAVLEHQEILDAWLARASPRVAALTAGHIRKTLADVQEQLAGVAEPPSRAA